VKQNASLARPAEFRHLKAATDFSRKLSSPALAFPIRTVLADKSSLRDGRLRREHFAGSTNVNCKKQQPAFLRQEKTQAGSEEVHCQLTC
jgi:hypothetical protein